MPASNVFELGIAKQTAKGVAAAAAAYRLLLAGGDIGPVRTVSALEETGGTRMRTRSFLAGVRAEGEPEMFVRDDFIGLLAYLAFGAQAISGAADPWTHTLTMVNAQPWFTVWRMLGDTLYERFVDCKVSRFAIHSEAGQAVRAILGIVGLTPQNKTSAGYAGEVIIAASDGPAFVHAHGQGALSIEGAPVTSIEMLDVNLTEGAAVQQGDAVGGYDVSEGVRELTIQARHAITDRALYNRFHYGSAVPADNAAPTPNVVELTGGIDFKWTRQTTPERSIQITAPRLEVANIEGYTPSPGGDPLKRTDTYVARQPTGGGTAATMLVKNAVSAIY